MTTKRKRLAKRLIKRLSGLDMPPEILFPSVLDQVMGGKILMVTWRQREKCSCSMCGGFHERIIHAISPCTKTPLKKLYKE